MSCKNDNRNYIWTSEYCLREREYQCIKEWVKPGARFIDLGCGNGDMLERLSKEKNIDGFGIELTKSGVDICQAKGLKVEQGSIDAPLSNIKDKSFDIAICNITLQMVVYPEIVLREMKRISKFQIVSFPNFAYFLQRLELLFMGRMPRRLLGGYDWYNTGHLHQFSILDFKNIVNTIGFVIKDEAYIVSKYKLPKWFFPNIFASEGIFLLAEK
ncbi:MAG: methionine biosynthesis protein MetW [Gammaproteobacteria bacterium]|nr:methionine biosynthesis protein MetW [Gammaproteobacteria bacterium]